MGNAARVVLVTGGARGVGKGISEAFLSNGDTVVICGRSAPERMPEVSGQRAQFIPCDVRDRGAVDALFAELGAEYGGLDVLVNNAGGAPFALADTASPRFHEKIIELNLLAPLHLAQRANALMQSRGTGGCIVFISSISGLRPSPGTAAYGAAKAGILSLVQSLAVEWAPRVRVVAVTPGLVRTEQSELHYGDEVGMAAVSATVPMGRMAEPSDIGEACVWLASPAASYASGTHLVLHGGGERPAFLGAANADHAHRDGP